MNEMHRNIQTIRRLIRAQRYEEAYYLLKQTNHPQVPALEAKLKPLVQFDCPIEPSRLNLLPRWKT